MRWTGSRPRSKPLSPAKFEAPAVFGFQSSLIFPTHAVPPAGPWPPDAERLSLQAPDGARLVGIHIPAEEASRSDPMILGLGGNAWNGQDVAEYLHQLFPDHDIVTFHYRGYAPSAGEASSEALIGDAPRVYDLAVARLNPPRVVVVGFSIGSGIGAHLASVRKVDGLILVTPFDSLKAVAQSMYPLLPIGPFFEHEIDTVAALETVESPVAIIAAERDEIVPAERTDALRGHVANLVFDRTIGAAGHNTLYARSDFQDAMRSALSKVLGSPSE